jgi:hypothetical protein
VFCLAIFIVGIILAREQLIAGHVILLVDTIFFRIYMALEWALFVWEKVLRPRLSAKTQRTKTHPILFHLAFQIIMLLSMVVGFAVAVAYYNVWNNGHFLELNGLSASHPNLERQSSLTGQIISIIYALHDFLTEGWTLWNLFRRWWTQDSVGVADGAGLVRLRSVEASGVISTEQFKKSSEGIE